MHVSTDPRLTGETVELLSTMIRNACVNDGTVESGQEIRNADTLTSLLEGTGLDLERFEPAPGRTSVVARIEGSDPNAPSLCLMGHTDVVPVTPSDWSRDPFGGEVVDGEVWGRGAVDMLNLTSSMAVAFRHLADTGFTPKGDLIFFGVADEEAGGGLGAGWCVDNAWDAVGADYVLTESGGLLTETPAGPRLLIATGEKGIGWKRLVISGTPGHGSMPYGSDNALVTAAEVVRRIATYAPHAEIGPHFTALVQSMGLDPEAESALLDPDRVDDALLLLPAAKRGACHAMTHMTFSPNVIAGGQKTNIIPDEVVLEVDIRTLPGQTEPEIRAALVEAVGDLADRVSIQPGTAARDASASDTDTPLWDILTRRATAAHPTAQVLPLLLVGGTDAAFYRAKGVTAYGAGLFASDVHYEDFRTRFHGVDERIDVGSLALSTQYWIDVATDMVG